MKNALKLILGSAGAAVLLGLAPLAQAQGYPDVSWSINVGSHGPVYAPPAVIYAPPPMVVRPHRVYVTPAPVRYYAPASYYGRPAWAGHRGHRHWERDHRGHGRDRHDRGHGRDGRDGRDGRGHR